MTEMASYSDCSSSEEEAAVDEHINDADCPCYKEDQEGRSSTEDTPDGNAVPEELSDLRPIMARAYQQEMLEASLKQNVIVAVHGPLTLHFDLGMQTNVHRWTLAAAKLKCKHRRFSRN